MRAIPIVTGLLLLSCTAPAQRVKELPTDTLAEVGATVIQARDLLERLELMPWPGKDRPGQADSVKVRALQSMVAERLLALEANARGLGQDSTSLLRTNMLEKMMVRDELYRREILPGATPTKAEMREGLRRYAYTPTVIIFVARSREGAGSIYGMIRRLSIDSALQVIPILLLERTDTLSFNFGDVEKSLEDAAYGIGTVGRVASPVYIPRLGWGVVGLLRKRPNEKYLGQSTPERNRAVENIVKQGKERELAAKFSGKVLAKKRGEADSVLFEKLAAASLRILRGDSVNLRKQGVFNLGVIADTLERELTSDLEKDLVKMDGPGLTLWEVVEGFRTRPVGYPTLDEEDFRNRLNSAIRDLVGAEYLAREGMHRGLQHSPKVRRDVATWADYWSSREMERLWRDSVRVTEEEISSYLIEHGGILGLPYEVNIREILSDSLMASISLLERIVKGEPMEVLARDHSKRRGWAERGGESLWFRVSAFPELGFRALETDSGGLVGPVRVKNGYSLFRVLGKRRAAGDTLISYDSLKTLTRAKVKQEKTKQVLDGRIADLAREHGATMHYDRLRRVEVTRQNMVTRRMIGFGGVMVAVPTIIPQFEWVKNVPDLKGVLP